MATSQFTNLQNLVSGAKLKGIGLLATGDCFHPKWLAELKSALNEKSEGFYEYNGVMLVVAGEISTVHTDIDGRTHRIHHLIYLPSLDTAGALAERLGKYGNMSSDGRPTIGLEPAALVDEVASTASRSEFEIVPAHVWTPWFSALGARAGFDSLEECYGERISEIHALETGLSSDPGMNWRVSALDRFSLLSNSDSHSHQPWRIGREANVFEWREPTYTSFINSLRTGGGLKFTLEVPPEFGKYHWTGHRLCGVSMPPAQARKVNDLCPVCGKKMTIGVEERVDQLSDRPSGFKPPLRPPYIKLLPLYELLLIATHAASYYTQSVSELFTTVITKYDNELNFIFNAPLDEVGRLHPTLEALVSKIRSGDLVVKPGYDGVYGVLAS
jgi:uncharacterized protein (TIGR00375 family)